MIGNKSVTTLTFATTENFDKFEVGQLVQGPDVVIEEIDSATKSMKVNGGTWGLLGSGNPSNLETERSGTGSVFLGTPTGILLRNNNQEWVDDFYVTAPEQLMAARKAVHNARLKAKK
jgi:hypothetical protein